MLRHELSPRFLGFLSDTRVCDRGMAPDASIRRPSAAAAAATESKANGSGAADSDNATPSPSSSPQSPSTPASRLVAPSSASGFAKFTHKGEDTWSNSTDLRVDVPGKLGENGRKSEGFHSFFSPIFFPPSFFSASRSRHAKRRLESLFSRRDSESKLDSVDWRSWGGDLIA